MINLIPPEAKTVVRREYMLRVYVVWACLLACALGASALMLLPTYVLLLKQSSFAGEAPSVSEEQYLALEGELVHARIVAQKLAVPEQGVKASTIISHLEDAVTPAIAMRAISITHTEEESAVSAAGSARTRESLREFLDALKADPFFLDARVPVSNLAQDVDVQFSLTLTLASH